MERDKMAFHCMTLALHVERLQPKAAGVPHAMPTSNSGDQAAGHGLQHHGD